MLATQIESSYRYSGTIHIVPPSDETITHVAQQVDAINIDVVQNIVSKYVGILQAYRRMHDTIPMSGTGTVSGVIEPLGLAKLADDRERMVDALEQRVANPEFGSTIMLLAKALLFKDRIRYHLPFAPRSIDERDAERHLVDYRRFLHAEETIAQAGDRLVGNFAKLAVSLRSSAKHSFPYLVAEGETLKALFPSDRNRETVDRVLASTQRAIRKNKPSRSLPLNGWTA